MTSIVTERTERTGAERTWPVLDEKTWGLVGLGAIVLVAAVLRFANLDIHGYANTYYSAAVKAMLQSWHNFFFAAAEPGGSVTVDKPPVGFWLQTISAYFLGVNVLGVELPQILAGLLSVVVVYHLVRRSFGTVAGLIAALVLAITPVAIATDRNNTIDSTLVLTLLFAAWAFIKATETGKLRHLLIGAVLVGIGFNIKMLEAYLPLPAFYALYFLGSKDRLLPKVGKLSLATAVLLVVSLSWATIVDLTPADQRPFVGSTTTNSELDLALGYNGIQRLIGMRGRGGLTDLSSWLDSLTRTATATGGQTTGDGRGQFQPGPGGPGGFGQFGTGQPGPLRLFTAPLSNEVSWLLPLSLFGVALLAFRSRLHWPVSDKHRALLLWGGWLVTSTVFFSIAGFFHPYYLTTMGPPIAALVGIGIVELWRVRENHRWLGLVLIGLSAGIAVLFELVNAATYYSLPWWAPLQLGLFLIGLVLLLPLDITLGRVSKIGLACVVAALLVTPAVWSGLTTMNTNGNENLPGAYGGQGVGGFGRGGFGGSNNLGVDETLINYLQANTRGMRYMLAVPSSQGGTSYVLATGRGVLYLGGFSGQDPVETPESLAQLVAEGQLRFIMVGGRGGFGGPGGGNEASISNWVSNTCKPVQNISTGSVGGFRGGFGGTLYDCAG